MRNQICILSIILKRGLVVSRGRFVSGQWLALPSEGSWAWHAVSLLTNSVSLGYWSPDVWGFSVTSRGHNRPNKSHHLLCTDRVTDTVLRSVVNPPNSPVRWCNFYHPCCTHKETEAETLSNLPKVLQQVSGGARVGSPAIGFQNPHSLTTGSGGGPFRVRMAHLSALGYVHRTSSPTAHLPWPSISERVAVEEDSRSGDT